MIKNYYKFFISDIVHFTETGEKFRVLTDPPKPKQNCTLKISSINLNKTFSYKVNVRDKDLPENIELIRDNCGASVTVNVNDTGLWTFQEKKCFIQVTKVFFSIATNYHLAEYKLFFIFRKLSQSIQFMVVKSEFLKIITYYLVCQVIWTILQHVT